MDDDWYTRQPQELRHILGALGAVSLPFLLLTAVNVAENTNEFVGVMGLAITALFAIRDAKRKS